MEKSQKPSMDQTFLQKLTSAIFSNLNNEQFGAEDLARVIGLSRSQIHRKLQKINGKSITQFIREIRLEKAHQLLEDEVGTGSEISYQVGFSSPAYFSKCFHEYFGYTPGNVKTIKKETQKFSPGEEDTTISPIHGKEAELYKEHNQQSNSKNRKHAAIMFTDIVGYTALMGSDEDRALEVLNKNRKIHSKYLHQYNGTLIKEMGDGMLISFNLASEAVRCAIEIQKACKQQDIPLKIGIHEGEMVFEGSDVLGDGVNIASRIQEDTEVGCIMISGSVYRDIKNKTGIRTEFLEEKIFKNVDEPLKVYKACGESEVIKVDTEPHPLPTKETIAVLPFVNMSGDPAQEYFSDGLTEEIITDLSHIKGLSVISRTSIMRLKGSEKDLKTIGKELNVRHILEGSVRKSGNNLRIISQLIDTATDEHIWAEKYDGTLKDVFDIQEKVSRSIVDALKLQLSSEEDKKIADHPIENAHAYEFYFRAKKAIVSLEEKILDKGLRDIQSGLDLVGDNELLHACKGRLYWQYVHAGIKGEDFLEKAEECCNKVFDLNPDSLYGYYLIAIIKYKRGKASEALNHVEKVLGTDSDNAATLKWFQEYDAEKGDNALLEKKLLEIDPLVSFDEYSLQIPAGHRDEARNILYYIKKPIVASTIIVILLLSGMVGWYINRNAKIRWARLQAIPEIEKLLDEDNNTAAYQIAVRAEKYIPTDPQFIDLISQVSSYISIQTEPPGADIFAKEYRDIEGDWEFLGQSPIDSIRLVDNYYRWRIVKGGYDTVRAVVSTYHEDTLFRKLDERGTLPQGMVRVLGNNTDIGTIPDFFIDKYEVTNKLFKEFLDAGGYQKQEYWKHQFIKDGKVLDWEEAINAFCDETGRPGPASWQAGDYPEGEDDYPVSGISWYEAAAYADFVGKSLPTIQHWGITTGLEIRSNYLFRSHIVPLSNFEGGGPVSVGSFEGMNCYGAYDMAGNVREWCWNSSREGRFIRGGAWNDADYLYGEESHLPPFSRSSKNGFRCAQYIDKDEIPDEVFQSFEYAEFRDYLAEKPVSDEIFQVYRNQFLYDKVNLDAIVEEIDESHEDYKLEKITFNAAYDGERIIALLYLPKNAAPPYQTVIFFPGAGALSEDSIGPHRYYSSKLDFIIKNGRAVMFPAYLGTFERYYNEIRQIYAPNESHAHSDYVVKLIKDFSRSIDYLETRPDIDCEKLAYYGTSWGGRMGLMIPAVEDRIGISILRVSGLWGRALPEVDAINYVSRVKIPVLMLNGMYDHIFLLEISVIPAYELLGTPKIDKDLKIYEISHHIPKSELVKESLNWLDKYFGPIEKSAE